MRYFEDFSRGEKTELGSYTFTAESIKRFAGAFDPQSFHLDEAAAAASLFGGLCASGWHTAAVWMRLMVDNGLRNSAADFEGQARPRIGPSPGFEAMQWLKPVMAGETISFTTEVIEMRASRSRPEWGLVISRNEGRKASSYASNARVIPCRIAPAWPVVPPPVTRTLMSNRPSSSARANGWRTIIRAVSRPKNTSNGLPLMLISPLPGRR